MVSKSVYPLEVPQRPQDFKPPAIPVERAPRNTAGAHRALADGLVRTAGQRELSGVWLYRGAGQPAGAIWMAVQHRAAGRRPAPR